MSAPNDRFEHVRANLGTIFDEGGMNAYFERLTAFNVDSSEYFEWLVTQDAAKPPTYSPAEVLLKMQENSLRDNDSMIDLSDALGNIHNNVIPLARDKKRKFLVGSDDMALSMGLFVPIGDDDEEVETITGTVGHPLVVELSPQVATSGTPLQPTRRPTVPRYVVVLGRLLIHDIRDISEIPDDERPETDIDPDARPFRPTNYAVVMDVITKERPVWLVYNRAPIDLEMNYQFESKPSDEDQPVLFPPSRNFDSAMVMSDVKMWRLDASELDLADVSSTVAATMANSPIVANPAPDADVRRALNPGQSD